MLRSLIKDSTIYTIPTVVSRGLALLLIPLYTRVLSPADYGALDLLTVFGTIVNLTIALEVSQGLARFHAGEADAQRKVAYASSALWFTVCCYGVFVSVALASSERLSALILGRAGLEHAFRIGVIYIGLSGPFYLIQNQFRWEFRSRQYAVVSLSTALVTAATGVWLAYFRRLGLEGFLFGLLTGVAVGATIGLSLLRTSFGLRFDRALLAQMLHFSLPLVPSSAAVWLNSYVDRMMINRYLGLGEVGVYGIGFRLVSAVSLILVGVQASLTPLIYARHSEPETPRELARIFRLFVAFALFVCLGMTLLASDLLRLVTTAGFHRGAEVVVFLVPATLLSQMYLFAPGPSIAGKTRFFMYINGAGAALNLLLNWVLVPRLGISGAALATMLAALLVFAAHMSVSQALYPVPHAWPRLLAAVVFAGLLTALVTQLGSLHALRWLVDAAALAVMAAVVVSLKLVGVDELAAALRMVRGLGRNAAARGPEDHGGVP